MRAARVNDAALVSVVIIYSVLYLVRNSLLISIITIVFVWAGLTSDPRLWPPSPPDLTLLLLWERWSMLIDQETRCLSYYWLAGVVLQTIAVKRRLLLLITPFTYFIPELFACKPWTVLFLKGTVHPKMTIGWMGAVRMRANSDGTGVFTRGSVIMDYGLNVFELKTS